MNGLKKYENIAKCGFQKPARKNSDARFSVWDFVLLHHAFERAVVDGLVPHHVADTGKNTRRLRIVPYKL
ncbi:MAG: hypothetical protein FWF33_05600 [Clostridiales bacterium]|nr:hypothetical protein [Clostridiales bacterium]